MRYVAPPASALTGVDLDPFTAVYHQPSGQTHLLVEPAPQILAALARPSTIDELLAALAAAYDIVGEGDALAARVAELVDAGLVAVA